MGKGRRLKTARAIFICAIMLKRYTNPAFAASPIRNAIPIGPVTDSLTGNPPVIRSQSPL